LDDDEDYKLFVWKYIKRNDVEHSDKNLIKFRKQTNNKGEVIVIKKDKSKRICYKCEQSGHCKTDCPNLKKKDKRKASKRGSMGRRA
jgi:radical SAM protein with 4Fe4S-binding SPASM domain